MAHEACGWWRVDWLIRHLWLVVGWLVHELVIGWWLVGWLMRLVVGWVDSLMREREILHPDEACGR